jgi:N-acetylmuramoyl-L-alanine amidase
MLPFAYYLLKISICSAVLFGYYWFALRNKVFHGYNRFYLLAIIGLSLTLPLCRINIFQEKQAPQTSVIKILEVVTASDEYIDEVIIAAPQKSSFSFVQILPLIYVLVSIVLLVMLIQMLLSIFVLWKKSEPIKMEQIHFINTDAAKGTPFSFFKYIFWNQQIDMHSPAGNRIFKHELAHIQERHSWDKMFINFVLIVFWSNPIFWLVRRELGMIHEFIADKRAVEDGDTAAFAAMILATTYPQHQNSITNNFFYSPIKRRLMILTKNKNPKANYISRLLVLPLLAIVFTAFTIKAKAYKEKLLIDNKKTESFLSNNVLQTIDKPQEVTHENNAQTEKPSNILAEKQITVVIDAGHGGTDPGVTNKDGISEKDLALQLVKKIKEVNTNANIKIILTRETDIYATPQAKADFAKANNADLFISIHLDDTPKEKWNTVSGLKVYVAKDEIPNSIKSKLLASVVIGNFKNNYGLEVDANPQQRQNSIRVLQANSFPSVLIEAGYLTNDKDAAYLLSKKGQETFANNVLNAINNFVANDAFMKNVSNNDDEKGIHLDEIVVTNGYFNSKSNSIQNNEYSESNKRKYPDTITWHTNDKQNTKGQVLKKVTTKPEFPGGNEAWKKFLMRNLNSSIPVSEKWVSGTYNILVKFIVEKDGTLVNITTENYTDSKTAKHCINVIKNGPKWVPAKQNGKIVAAYRLQPITFIISNPEANYQDKISNLDPVFRIGNLTSDRVKVDEFKKQKLITVTDGYDFFSCNVYFGGTGFPKVEAANLNGNNFTKLNTFLEKCAAGTSIAFTNIHVKNKDGLRTIEEKVYTLY